MEKVFKAIGLVLIASILLSLCPAVIHAQAPTTVKMWIEPSSISLNTAEHSIGYRFDVVVWVDATGYECGGWQFKMIYPKAYLKAVACEYTGSDKRRSGWFESCGTKNLMPLTPTIDSPHNATHNYVLHGEAYDPTTPGNPYPTGSGSLSKVTFEVVGLPGKGETIEFEIDIRTECTPPRSKTYVIDKDGVEILYPQNVFNCLYTFVWSPPPKPYLGVYPVSQEHGMYENVIGKPVPVSIFIYSLDAAWFLTNASFTLTYDSTLVNITESDIAFNTAAWDVAAQATITDGTITFFVETSKQLSGTVKIADLVFTIIYQGAYPEVKVCTLDLKDIVLMNHELQIPTKPEIDGEIRIIGLLTMPLPYFSIVPKDTVIGPDPSLGKTFTVDLVMNELHEGWKLVAYGVRIGYDNTLLEVVDVKEGPFLSTTTSWGYTALEDVYLGPAEPPLYMTNITFKLKAKTTFAGTYTFTITPPGAVRIIINGTLTNTFTVTGAVERLFIIEIRNYNPYPVEGDYIISCRPTTYGVTLTDVTDPANPVVLPWTRNVAAPPYSWFFTGIEPDGIYGPHIAIGGMVATDTGEWYIFPSGTGTLATITFKVIKQGYTDLSCALNIFDEIMIDKDGRDIPFKDSIDGTVTVKGLSLPGRQIDLYTQYPAPFGGQGPNKPSDMFTPQQEVLLYALVTYNYWPLQNKLVSYEIKDPGGKVWDKKTATTNQDGIAVVSFRMPWPCENPESLFGVWTVIATVDIADVVVNDTLQFHYNYLAFVSKVTTDKLEYDHGDTVTISVEVKSYAMQTYNILVTAAITDELGYTIGFAAQTVKIGGATFCSAKTYKLTFTIKIPKWAVAGLAKVHVNVFNKEPAEGGFALCPEYSPAPVIYIKPY
ncbi:MAG: hypothetical protein QXO67_03845 [Candidatus Bathyarchaeia archaeon]